MACQSLPQLQNRYPNNLWAELVGNADTQLMLGCTDDVSAEYFSSRSGDMTVEVNSTMTTRQSIAMAQVIPQYRYTEGLGRRRLLTPDEVLRLPNDELLIIIRGQKVLRARKFDYTSHPYAKDCVKASILDYKSNHSPPLEPEIIQEEPATAGKRKQPKPQSQKPTVSGTAPPPAPDISGQDTSKPGEAVPHEEAAPSPASPQQQEQPIPPKPARRPKTLYESSRPPVDF